MEKDKSKGMVVLPYVEGLSETTSRIMKCARNVMPHTSLKRNVLGTRIKTNTKKALRKYGLADPTPEASVKEMHKSAMTDHMTQQNHILD